METKDPAICEWIYGPVKSRRHGNSLGINVGAVKNKICTWGCVYCQCGFGERRDFIETDSRPTKEQILNQLKTVVLKNPDLDSITFAGNTEPGTHPEINSIIKEIMELKTSLGARWVVNCLSNGSELHQEKVISAFNMLDESWIKFDCADEDQYKKLNRPLERLGTVQDQINRMKKLKNLRIQTLLWTSEDPRLSNWNEKNLSGLIDAFKILRPLEIHLTTVAREPAMHQLQPVHESKLIEFAKRLQNESLNVKIFP